MNLRVCFICGALRDTESAEHIEWHKRLQEALNVSLDKAQDVSHSASADACTCDHAGMYEALMKDKAWHTRIAIAAIALVEHREVGAFDFICPNCRNNGVCDEYGALWRDLREAVDDRAATSPIEGSTSPIQDSTSPVDGKTATRCGDPNPVHGLCQLPHGHTGQHMNWGGLKWGPAVESGAEPKGGSDEASSVVAGDEARHHEGSDGHGLRLGMESGTGEPGRDREPGTLRPIAVGGYEEGPDIRLPASVHDATDEPCCNLPPLGSHALTTPQRPDWTCGCCGRVWRHNTSLGGGYWQEIQGPRPSDSAREDVHVPGGTYALIEHLMVRHGTDAGDCATDGHGLEALHASFHGTTATASGGDVAPR